MDINDSILVTGAGGFIGGHLCRELFLRGYWRITGVDVKSLSEWCQRPASGMAAVVADLRDYNECRDVCEDQDYVFNLAADMGGMGFIESHQLDCMLSSLITTNMLRAADETGVERLFYSSSACVYPDYLQDENHRWATLKESDAYPAMPEDGYGWEKLFGERMCRHFHIETQTLETRVGRYHNIYGPHGTWQGGREKAPAAICRKVAEAKLTGNDTINIWGDGEQTRSFTYIDDCLDGTLRLMNHDMCGPWPINIGSDETVTINQLVTEVEDIAGVALERRYVQDAPLGVRGRSSDNTLCRQVLDWEPTTSLRDGLEVTYNWILEEVQEAMLTKG